jgi:hypothetical protein
MKKSLASPEAVLFWIAAFCFCVLMPLSSFAGGGSFTYCLCVKDESCAQGGMCGGPTGCETQNFTVPCTADYHFVSQVICSSGDDCADCQACVIINENGQVIANCHNTHCSDLQRCSDSYKITLRQGHQYTLEVCLGTCLEGRPCTDCGGSCVAYGCVYRNVPTPCVPLTP